MNLFTNTHSTNYKKIKPLGEGSFGKVFLVKNIIDQKIVVSKEIDLKGM